jgi:hypothetical protein
MGTNKAYKVHKGATITRPKGNPLVLSLEDEDTEVEITAPRRSKGNVGGEVPGEGMGSVDEVRKLRNTGRGLAEHMSKLYVPRAMLHRLQSAQLAGMTVRISINLSRSWFTLALFRAIETRLLPAFLLAERTLLVCASLWFHSLATCAH